MKTFKLLGVIAIPLSVLLTGCAIGNSSISNESSETLQQKLVKGKTTKEQVLSQFGEPSERGTNEGVEYWAYQTATSSAVAYIPFASLVTGNSGIRGKYLRIVFNKKGLVDSYDTTETKL